MFNSGNAVMPFTMPVEPAGSGNNNNGNGWGGDGAWLIWIVLIFALFGWGGNGGWGNNSGNGGGTVPYMVGSTYTDAAIARGFDTQTIVGKLDGINAGICDSTFALNNTIANGFAGVNQSLCQGFNGVNTNIMQGNFGLQQAINNAAVANMQGQNAIQSQLASCCCGIERAIDGVNYNMATNTCAITNQMNNNTRDIIDSQNAGTRAILDYLCNDKISTLQNENQALRLAASQANQNAAIGAMIDASTANIIRRTGNDCPIPAYVVPNPNCCYNPTVAFNSGCGCGNGCGCA